MVQSDKNSNSAGRVIIESLMTGTCKKLNGVTLTKRFNSGNLSFDIPAAKENCGYLQEILSSTLRLLTDGNISTNLDTS